MELDDLRAVALSHPETTEAPHHHRQAFKVAGKIFCTVDPSIGSVNVLFPDDLARQALAEHGDAVSPVHWGARLAGVSIELATVEPKLLELLVADAWAERAPARLLEAVVVQPDAAAAVRKKLQLTANQTLGLLDPPEDLAGWFGPVVGAKDASVLVAFAITDEQFRTQAKRLAAAAHRGVVPWLAYPKAKGLGTTLSRDRIREGAVAFELDTVRQVAIDDRWSALRLKLQAG